MPEQLKNLVQFHFRYKNVLCVAKETQKWSTIHFICFYPSLLLPVCTPLGFVRLFGVVGQVLVKPHLLRDVDSEFDAFNMEEASVRRKLAASKDGGCGSNNNHIIRENGEFNVMKVVVSPAAAPSNGHGKLFNRVHLQEHKYEAGFLHERLREIEADKNELGESQCASFCFLFTNFKL